MGKEKKKGKKLFYKEAVEPAPLLHLYQARCVVPLLDI